MAEESDHHHHDRPLSEIEERVKKLEALLIEKKLVDPATLDKLVDTYENQVGPKNGARVVARAWVDSEYRQRLLSDATSAISELCLLYTSPSPRDGLLSRMPSSA